MMSSLRTEITFLGTGTSQGVPVITCSCPVCKSSDPRDQRLRTSALVHFRGKAFVVDAGPDFRQQMLREEVKDIDAVLLTHEHKDHIGGLDDIRPFNFVHQKSIPIYAESRVHETVKREFSYVFHEKKYPGVPEMNLQEISEGPFDCEGEGLLAVRGMHMHLPVLGFRFGHLAYVTDVNFLPQHSMQKLTGLKVLVINCLRHEEHYSHFNLEQALEVIRVLKPQKTYLTHISHALGKYDAVEKQLPPNVHLAYDGLHIKL